MKQYEYTTLYVPKGKALHEELNNFASEGWRAMQVVYLADNLANEWAIVFERIKPKQ